MRGPYLQSLVAKLYRTATQSGVFQSLSQFLKICPWNYALMLQMQICDEKPPVLAGVAQWIECRPENQRVAGLIPSLGHMPGLLARSPVGAVWGSTTH